jgi:TolA-binding protein
MQQYEQQQQQQQQQQEDAVQGVDRASAGESLLTLPARRLHSKTAPDSPPAVVAAATAAAAAAPAVAAGAEEASPAAAAAAAAAAVTTVCGVAGRDVFVYCDFPLSCLHDAFPTPPGAAVVIQ